MATVAILMVWVWTCPVCETTIKARTQQGTEYLSHQHCTDEHSDIPYETRPGCRGPSIDATHKTWVFNIVVGPLGD